MLGLTITIITVVITIIMILNRDKLLIANLIAESVITT